MMQYAVRMLCVGLVHGDLSEFSALVDEYGPVITDKFQPQIEARSKASGSTGDKLNTHGAIVVTGATGQICFMPGD